MRYLFPLLWVVFVPVLGWPVVASSNEVQHLNAAGATFPYPLYARWASDYNQQTGIRINYQSIGSGGGVRQIIARTVDFGATDDPLPANQLAEHGLVPVSYTHLTLPTIYSV